MKINGSFVIDRVGALACPSGSNNVGGTKNQQTDFGVHYVMAGHNARISAVYSKLKDPLAANVKRDQFIVGLH